VNPKRSPSSSRIEATFGFIDLEGFTALTEAQGDDDAADVATRFADLTRSVLGPGVRLVKTIGDAVLVTSPSADSGVALVERLITEAAEDPRLPALRAGLHHGDAVTRDDDVFGAAVNLAARVAAEANAGEVLGTDPIAAAARDRGIPVAELGAVALKNVRGTVPLFSLALVVGATDTPTDPVCQILVDRRGAAGHLVYQEKEYWFCSLACAAAFASNPRWHTKGD
jgi:adenylate cyclase